MTTCFVRDPTGRNDQERNVQLGLVEARAVAEDAGVLAEAFAVVRRDDQPGSLEDAAAPQLVEQLPELLVEVGDAIVIGVDDERQVGSRPGVPCPGPPSG